MRSILDEIVVNEDNRYVMDKVLHITDDHDEPIRMFIYGPAQSGKTMLLQARGKERDLLSSKNVMFCHAAEVLSYITLGELGEDFLGKIGDADVLMIDGLEAFLDDKEMGPLVCKLLLQERNSQGRETVIASRIPYDDIEEPDVLGVITGYEKVELTPLHKEDYIEVAQKVRASYTKENENVPVIGDDVLDYLANERAECPDDIHTMLRFFYTSGHFAEGKEITLENAKEALGEE